MCMEEVLCGLQILFVWCSLGIWVVVCDGLQHLVTLDLCGNDGALEISSGDLLQGLHNALLTMGVVAIRWRRGFWRRVLIWLLR